MKIIHSLNASELMFNFPLIQNPKGSFFEDKIYPKKELHRLQKREIYQKAQI